MGHDQHGQAGAGQVADDGEHFGHHGGIQSAGRLVEKQDLWMHGKGSGDGDALFLAAGKFVGIVTCLIGQTDSGQLFHGFAVGVLRRFSQKTLLGDHDIFHRHFVGKEVKGLEDHAHDSANFGKVGGRVAYVYAVHGHGSRGGGLQPVDTAEQSGFTGPGWADDADHFSLFDVRVDSLQRGDRAIFFFQISDLYQTHASTPLIFRSSCFFARCLSNSPAILSRSHIRTK